MNAIASALFVGTLAADPVQSWSPAQQEIDGFDQSFTATMRSAARPSKEPPSCSADRWL